jgi:small subunit ribosomal protein S3e
LSMFLTLDCALKICMSFPGVLGIKVKIMLPWDPTGKLGPKRPLPDHVSIVEPKEEKVPPQPYSEQKGQKPSDTPAPPVATQ